MSCFCQKSLFFDSYRFFLPRYFLLFEIFIWLAAIITPTLLLYIPLVVFSIHLVSRPVCILALHSQDRVFGSLSRHNPPLPPKKRMDSLRCDDLTWRLPTPLLPFTLYPLHPPLPSLHHTRSPHHIHIQSDYTTSPRRPFLTQNQPSKPCTHHLYHFMLSTLAGRRPSVRSF
jgi:hypothetical protein